MPRPCGRPKLKPDERLAHSLKFRCNSFDLATIAKQAKACRMDMSEYLRHIALNGKVSIDHGKGLDPAVFTELKRQGVELHRWGNNLNQIAAELHKQRQFPSDSLDHLFDRAANLCSEIEDQLRASLDIE